MCGSAQCINDYEFVCTLSVFVCVLFISYATHCEASWSSLSVPTLVSFLILEYLEQFQVLKFYSFQMTDDCRFFLMVYRASLLKLQLYNSLANYSHVLFAPCCT